MSSYCESQDDSTYLSILSSRLMQRHTWDALEVLVEGVDGATVLDGERGDEDIRHGGGAPLRPQLKGEFSDFHPGRLSLLQERLSDKARKEVGELAAVAGTLKYFSQ